LQGVKQKGKEAARWVSDAIKDLRSSNQASSGAAATGSGSAPVKREVVSPAEEAHSDIGLYPPGRTYWIR
jgi:hypothetical protein